MSIKLSPFGTQKRDNNACVAVINPNAAAYISLMVPYI